jgi:hypothetical protein
METRTNIATAVLRMFGYLNEHGLVLIKLIYCRELLKTVKCYRVYKEVKNLATAGFLKIMELLLWLKIE